MPEDVNNKKLSSDINLEVYCPFCSKDFANLSTKFINLITTSITRIFDIFML